MLLDDLGRFELSRVAYRRALEIEAFCGNEAAAKRSLDQLCQLDTSYQERIKNEFRYFEMGESEMGETEMDESEMGESEMGESAYRD
jgi:hypothetical protein